MMNTSSPTLSLTKCHTCTSVSNLKLCSCGQAAYCSTSCQLKDWVRHKKDCPMVVVKEMEGKGKGLVALRTIAIGTVIFTEEPLIVLKQENGVTCISPVKFEQFKKMKPGQYQDLMELYDPKQMDPQMTEWTEYPDPEYMKFCRIVCTNGLGISYTDDDDDACYTGVYKMFSRLNHSCNASTGVEYEGETTKMEVRVIKTVKKGDELTFNYLGGKWPIWEERRNFLQHYFFYCSCEVCSLTGKEREKNDQARISFVKQMEKIKDVKNPGKQTDTQAMSLLSTALCNNLELLSTCYSMESQTTGVLPKILCGSHCMYQKTKSMGIKVDCPGEVKEILTNKLGINFLEVLDKKALSAAKALDKSEREEIRQLLEHYVFPPRV